MAISVRGSYDGWLWPSHPMESVQPVFLIDACKQHLGLSVFSACAAAHIMTIVVPAKTAWLLQPLETHGFALYKVYLMRKYQAARIRSADGVVGVGELLNSMYAATRAVLDGRDWSTALAHNGYGTVVRKMNYPVASSTSCCSRLQSRCHPPGLPRSN